MGNGETHIFVSFCLGADSRKAPRKKLRIHLTHYLAF